MKGVDEGERLVKETKGFDDGMKGFDEGERLVKNIKGFDEGEGW